ncbi:MAG: hypothetical protein WAT78_10575 [Rhizobiaceae bacterium]
MSLPLADRLLDHLADRALILLGAGHVIAAAGFFMSLAILAG